MKGKRQKEKTSGKIRKDPRILGSVAGGRQTDRQGRKGRREKKGRGGLKTEKHTKAQGIVM